MVVVESGGGGSPLGSAQSVIERSPSSPETND